MKENSRAEGDLGREDPFLFPENSLKNTTEKDNPAISRLKKQGKFPKSSSFQELKDAIQNPDHQIFRYCILLLTFFPLIASYFCYDIVAALSSYIKQDFGSSNSNFGLLYTVYEIPNVIMPIIGGIILDSIGIRLGGLLFASLVLLGVVIVAAGPYFHSYTAMLLGRAVYGLGSESMYVAMDIIYAKWFKGKGLAFAVGLGTTAGRLGDVLSFNLAPLVAVQQQDYKVALLLAPIFCVVGLAAMLLYALMDKFAEAHWRQNRIVHAHHEPPSGSLLLALRHLPGVFWLISLICVTYYSCLFPFQAFAPDFLQRKYGYSSQGAARATSIMSTISMVATPLIGLIVDRIGKRALCVAGAAAVILPAFALLAFSMLTPLVGMSVVGLGFCIVPAALWPALAIVIPVRYYGTAYGTMTALINLGLVTTYWALGFVTDAFDSELAVPLSLFTVLSVGFIAAIVWNVWDARTGGWANANDAEIAALHAAQVKHPSETAPLLQSGQPQVSVAVPIPHAHDDRSDGDSEDYLFGSLGSHAHLSASYTHHLTDTLI